MEKDNQWFIWVDWERRVISFHREDEFTEVGFSSHEEMIAFAVEKSVEGFGIQ